MHRKTTYIVLEGSEGTGKSTQTKLLVETLRSKGYSVLETKEPGTDHAPLTMKLRGIMLDGKYENEMTKEGREMISQAIRSIHLNKVIYPALGKYDFIIQDRGILSGTAYGVACDNPLEYITYLAEQAIGEDGRKLGYSLYNIYDHVVVFQGNVNKGLARALTAKQEFESGDAMENKGISFLEKVNQNFVQHSQLFQKVTFLEVDNKDIKTISNELLKILDIV